MKTAVWMTVFAVLTAATLPACSSSSRTSESAGQYVDSASITAQVKSQLVADPQLSALDISVETFKDQVQLSGFVDSAAAKQQAGEVAAGVPGVKSVRNNLIVKQ